MKKVKPLIAKKIVALADFLKQKCPNVKKVDLRTSAFGFLRPMDSQSSYNKSCLLGGYLVQAIHAQGIQQLSVTVDLRHSPEDTATFLRTSASAITQLNVHPGDDFLQPKDCSDVAQAIASLQNLVELDFSCHFGPLVFDSNLAKNTWLEITRQNKMRLRTVCVYAGRISGIGTFLLSEAATKLEKLFLYPSFFDRLDALELIVGLEMSKSVTKLTLGRGSPESRFDADALDIFCQFWQKPSSIKWLDVPNLGLSSFLPFFDPLLSALEENTTLSHLTMDGFHHGFGALKQLLPKTQTLTSLELSLYEPDFSVPEFCVQFSEGFLQNQSLTHLNIKVEFDGDEDDPDTTDISWVLDAITNRDTVCVLQKLRLNFRCGLLSEMTWASMINLLQHPACNLQSLELKLSHCRKDPVISVVDAATKSNSLTHLDLDFLCWNREEVDIDPEVYVGIYSRGLRNCTPNLKRLELDLPGRQYAEDFETWEQEEIKAKILECMTENTYLEEFGASSMTTLDSEFRNAVQLLCLRNKIENVGIALSNGTLDPMSLPEVLLEVEEKSKELHFSTDLAFVRIWFWLIQSRPLEASKFCP